MLRSSLLILPLALVRIALADTVFIREGRGQLVGSACEPIVDKAGKPIPGCKLLACNLLRGYQIYFDPQEGIAMKKDLSRPEEVEFHWVEAQRASLPNAGPGPSRLRNFVSMPPTEALPLKGILMDNQLADCGLENWMPMKVLELGAVKGAEHFLSKQVKMPAITCVYEGVQLRFSGKTLKLASPAGRTLGEVQRELSFKDALGGLIEIFGIEDLTRKTTENGRVRYLNILKDLPDEATPEVLSERARLLLDAIEKMVRERAPEKLTNAERLMIQEALEPVSAILARVVTRQLDPEKTRPIGNYLGVSLELKKLRARMRALAMTETAGRSFVVADQSEEFLKLHGEAMEKKGNKALIPSTDPHHAVAHLIMDTQHSTIGELDFLGHGSSGLQLIGNKSIRAEAFSFLDFQPGGKIFFDGCQVANGNAGADFLDSVAKFAFSESQGGEVQGYVHWGMSFGAGKTRVTPELRPYPFLGKRKSSRVSPLGDLIVPAERD